MKGTEGGEEGARGRDGEREGRKEQEEIGEEGNIVAPPILCTRFVAHQG